MSKDVAIEDMTVRNLECEMTTEDKGNEIQSVSENL